LDAGGKGLGVRLRPGERRFDIGNFESYFRAFVEFALADPKLGAGLKEFIAQLVAPASSPAKAAKPRRS
jgi:UTP--glucose-1-phosphate uridylyltransferase